MRLTPAQRLVLYYMAFETVYHGRAWFTFEDIRAGTGLAVRTLRAALVALRRQGFVESFMVPGMGKKMLHRLRLEKILPEPELQGLYLVDYSGEKLTPDAISVISRAEVVLYTENVPVKKLEGLAKRLKPFKGEIPQASSVAVVFNSLLDWDKVAPLAAKARYICASSALDKAVGICLTCGEVDIDLKTIRIKTPGPDLANLLDKYELVGTLTVQGCGGGKAELAVLRKRS
ncbi:helix-turn-helix domain-containing protein [Pyrobaculum sp.]|uniref:helix-turn-helix domain-containing protein n=1 Tax=Pyrobaculum sp. TaxID=2004705 RepID=UPI00316B146F